MFEATKEIIKNCIPKVSEDTPFVIDIHKDDMRRFIDLCKRIRKDIRITNVKKEGYDSIYTSTVSYRAEKDIDAIRRICSAGGGEINGVASNTVKIGVCKFNAANNTAFRVHIKDKKIFIKGFTAMEAAEEIARINKTAQLGYKALAKGNA